MRLMKMKSAEIQADIERLEENIETVKEGEDE